MNKPNIYLSLRKQMYYITAPFVFGLVKSDRNKTLQHPRVRYSIEMSFVARCKAKCLKLLLLKRAIVKYFAKKGRIKKEKSDIKEKLHRSLTKPTKILLSVLLTVGQSTFYFSWELQIIYFPHSLIVKRAAVGQWIF